MQVRRLFLVGLLVLGLLIACGGADPGSSKYKQTWTKGYDQTTCPDWLNTMDNHQRFVAAADMLLTLRKRDGDDAIPEDPMINAFAVEISAMCGERAGDMADSILDIGPIVYIAFSDQFAP